MRRLILSFCLMFVLTACAAPTMTGPRVDKELIDTERKKQYEMVVEENFRQYDRLNRVGFAVLKSNADWCGRDGRARPSIGILTSATSSIKEPIKGAVKRILDITGDAGVVTVVPKNTPGSNAGLQRGDVITKLNDEVIPADVTAKKLADAIKKHTDASFTAGKPLMMTVARNGQNSTKSVSPVLACDFYLAVEDKNDVNAFADGKGIVFSKGMMKFAENDDELAVVMGHELGHNLNRHIDAKKTNLAGGMLLDVLAGAVGGVNTGGMFSGMAANAYSQDFEREADYVGLYLTARAGYEIDHAANFWRRMAVENPATIKQSHTASHPATAERFVSLDATVDEIQDKLAKKQKLQPDSKLRF